MPDQVFLHGPQQDGAFLVRDCSVDTDSEPLVLVVYNEKKVYNVKIRFIKDTGKYALGMQRTNNVRLVDARQVLWSVTTTHNTVPFTSCATSQMFDTVTDIIKYHNIFPIMLISGRAAAGGRCPENCLLTCPVTRRDVQQLLQ